MNAHTGTMMGGPMTPDEASALVNGFAVPLAHGIRIADLLPKAFVDEDPDAGMIEAGTVARAGGQARWVGERDPLGRDHPVSSDLHAKLARAPAAIPEPDESIVAKLARFREFAKTGPVVTIRGVPIPAGAAQTAYYIALRWRPLFSPLADPARVYRGDLAYDAAHVTDEMQESTLLVGTRVHRDNLVRLQETAPALFVAIWMRQLEAAERLAKATLPDLLPPCYPRSRIRDRRRCLMIVSDIMAEHERGFELLDALKFLGGVTHVSVMNALASSTAMTRIHAVDDNTHRHIAGAVGHWRTMHSSMNQKPPSSGVDPIFEDVKSGIVQSRLYRKQYRRVQWVSGAMPVRYFLGIEPMWLMPVMLIQMQENLAQHEGKFWLRGAKGPKAVRLDALSKRLMHQAIVIASNICVPTARAMVGDDGLRLDRIWLHQEIPALIRNPTMQEELDREAKRRDDREIHGAAVTRAAVPSRVAGDSDDFKNSYAEARRRAKLCSKPVGQPGWTQGFRPDAWRKPLAELDFLRDCCRYVQYDAKLAAKRDRWNRVTGRNLMPDGRPVTAADVYTGLPHEHPLIRVQEVFRRQFDRLQVPELVVGAEKSEAWARREVFIREVARLLPALGPMTDDPYLHERYWIDPKSQNVRIAVEGAWNC